MDARPGVICQVPSDQALAIAAGTPGLPAPGELVAFVYASREWFEHYRAVNRRDHAADIIPLGPWPTDGGVLGILDLRPSITAARRRAAARRGPR